MCIFDFLPIEFIRVELKFIPSHSDGDDFRLGTEEGKKGMSTCLDIRLGSSVLVELDPMQLHDDGSVGRVLGGEGKQIV